MRKALAAYQTAWSCVYQDTGRGYVFLSRSSRLVRPGYTVELPLPYCTVWPSGITLQLYGLVGEARDCPADPISIGPITARTRAVWTQAAGCSLPD